MKAPSNPTKSSPVQTVPYSTINRFEPHFLDEWAKRVQQLTIKAQFIGGEWIHKVESRLATLAKVTEVRTCANGTDALQLALRAFGVTHGDRVLIPDFTFWATFEAVCNVGAKAITVDVDPVDFHISARMVEEAIHKFSPKAVILVHLFGWAAKDTLQIRNLCAAKGVPLIEDSAQAWGVTLNHQSIFKDALISTTSFFPGKVLGAAGDGGAIFTNDSELGDRLRLLANHGRVSKYEHHLVGWNSRFDNLQAAFLDLALDYTPERLTSRRAVTQWYRENLNVRHLKLHSPSEIVEENGYISVATVAPETRVKVIQQLDIARVGFGIVYPKPIRLQIGAQEHLDGTVNHGNTDLICNSILNLPCFSGMTPAELEYVKATLENPLA